VRGRRRPGLATHRPVLNRSAPHRFSHATRRRSRVRANHESDPLLTAARLQIGARHDTNGTCDACAGHSQVAREPARSSRGRPRDPDLDRLGATLVRHCFDGPRGRLSPHASRVPQGTAAPRIVMDMRHESWAPNPARADPPLMARDRLCTKSSVGGSVIPRKPVSRLECGRNLDSGFAGMTDAPRLVCAKPRHTTRGGSARAGFGAMTHVACPMTIAARLSLAEHAMHAGESARGHQSSARTRVAPSRRGPDHGGGP